MFLSTAPQVPQSSCLGCGGNCAGDCYQRGRGMSGLGIFDSGLDFAQWGLMEWLIVGGGLFLAFGGVSMFGGSKSDKRKSLRLAKAKYDLERAEL